MSKPLAKATIEKEYSIILQFPEGDKKIAWSFPTREQAEKKLEQLIKWELVTR